MVPLLKNDLVWSTNYWGRQFKVTFDVKVTNDLQKTWHNILHITQGSKDGQYGDQIPAIWANKAKYFHICSAVNEDPQYCKNHNYQLNQWYHFEIKQVEKLNGKIVYSIKIDGITIHEVVNSMASRFKEVDLYLSDPWSPSLASFGKLKNLKVVNLENC